MITATTHEEQDLTFVDNEEGFDVLKRASQKKDREDATSGDRTDENMFIVTSFFSKNIERVKITYQDHDDAF